MPSEFERQLRREIPRAASAAVVAWSLISIACGQSKVERPDLQNVKPLATCGLQPLGTERESPRMDAGVAFNYAPAAANDPLANYQRTALGDWQMPSEVDRENPWLRFVLLAQRRPVVIDLAVFVEGKPYADNREAWIDDALNQKKTADSATPAEPEESSSATRAKKRIVPEVTDPNKVAAQSRQAPSMRDRLQDYVSTAGAAVDRREIRWLISEWGFGPPVVVLDQTLSWQRAGVAPLLALLDKNRSGALEASELAEAIDKLQRADANSDDVVDVDELLKKVHEPPVLPYTADHPLVFAIDDATDMPELSAVLMRLYGLNSDRINDLLNGPADASLRVDFGGDSSTSDAVTLLALGSEFAEASDASASDDAITLDLGAEYVEFSAAGANKKSAVDIAATQIAVGAVVDGNPLLRLVDSNQDQRLTQRERQQLPALLASLDRDSDQQVTGAELPIPIRFAVTLGPQVHRLLAKPSGTTRRVESQAPSKLPDWFLSMDTNSDRDLSRAEFLGTAEQFGQFDADGDGLLSVDEALKMAPGQ